MKSYSQEELKEAERVLASLHSKCEKAREKLNVGSSQYGLLTNRIKGLAVALDLVEEKLTEEN